MFDIAIIFALLMRILASVKMYKYLIYIEMLVMPLIFRELSRLNNEIREKRLRKYGK